MRRRGGYSLIELLIAMVIAATLAAMAIPSYRNYIVRTQRTEARQALAQARAAQERFFLQHNRYAQALPPAPPEGLGLPSITASGLYELEVDLTAQGFTLRARPTASGGQRDDSRCAVLTLNESGLRSATSAAGADSTAECWR